MRYASTPSRKVTEIAPSEGTESRQPALFTLALVAMCIPVAIIGGSGIEIAPIDLIGPTLLIALLATQPKDPVNPTPGSSTMLTLLWFTAILGFVAMLYRGMTASEDGIAQQFGSFLFTMRPIVFLFIGALLASRPWANLAKIIRTMATGGTLTCVAVSAQLMINGAPHHQYGDVQYAGVTQFGEHLSGSFLGLPLYARYGVNSLAETYAIYGVLALAALASFPLARFGSWTLTRLVQVLWFSAGVAASTYLCVTSLSRQAQLALGLTLGAVLIAYVVRRTLGGSHALALGITLFAAIVLGINSLRALVWDVVQQGGLDVFAAGRVSILSDALAQVSQHPFTGTGFLSGPDGDINSHNLLLNIALKMGILAALFYMALLLYPTLPALRRLRTGSAPPSTLIVDLGWCVLLLLVGLVSNSIDVVTASGPLLLLLGHNYQGWTSTPSHA